MGDVRGEIHPRSLENSLTSSNALAGELAGEKAPDDAVARELAAMGLL